ncbi:hypothetical protein BAE42_10310 [Mesorhizobium loti]|uniref:Uncharacterized protein n=1 Tax=Rhizobium loti TaxID=381 RepID=A0A1A5IIE9_RHILI|nr:MULTISPECIES: hypothetical protein [Mesorhizobium]ANN61034.1 hypothetical protein A9174_33040 [Mesorhizobium loti NZP2037]OBP73549.1 hypothetical protein BAE42_10310 [Mesorhizobium loti]OBP78552.1 hypothetical protein BAE41_30415 [Mesorhizobium loti]OBP82037.1 hypothetical protein BAE39_00080 [Mesorhizobium loti]OBP97344.1 hypothetical protein BAE38_00090 [Mesorhizobium loti]
MATDGQTQRFAQVLEKMPAVGDLRCIGSTATGALGINAGTIARDDLDARMALSRDATVPAFRSGNRSSTRSRAKSQMIVP